MKTVVTLILHVRVYSVCSYYLKRNPQTLQKTTAELSGLTSVGRAQRMAFRISKARG